MLTFMYGIMIWNYFYVHVFLIKYTQVLKENPQYSSYLIKKINKNMFKAAASVHKRPQSSVVLVRLK